MTEKKDIILIGGGGHCKSVIDTLQGLNEYNIFGIVDFIKSDVLGIKWIGTDDDLENFYLKGITHAFVSVGSIGDVSIRKRLFKKLKKIGFTLPNIIDQTAITSKNISLGEGNFIGKNVVVNAGSQIGNMTIINTSATIEHDCKIEDYVHVSPGAVLCGNVTAEKETHIGANTMIIQDLTIGENTMIGAGSVVIQNINARVKAVGNPCKVIGEQQ